MAKKQEISLKDRQKIVAHYKTGIGYRKIEKEMKIPWSSVRHIIKKWKSTGSVLNR